MPRIPLMQNAPREAGCWGLGATSVTRSPSSVSSAPQQVLHSQQVLGTTRFIFLELLHPGPQLDLEAPGRAVLPVHVEVGLRDRIGMQHAVFAARSGARV